MESITNEYKTTGYIRRHIKSTKYSKDRYDYIVSYVYQMIKTTEEMLPILLKKYVLTLKEMKDTLQCI